MVILSSLYLCSDLNYKTAEQHWEGKTCKKKGTSCTNVLDRVNLFQQWGWYARTGQIKTVFATGNTIRVSITYIALKVRLLEFWFYAGWEVYTVDGVGGSFLWTQTALSVYLHMFFQNYHYPYIQIRRQKKYT